MTNTFTFYFSRPYLQGQSCWVLGFQYMKWKWVSILSVTRWLRPPIRTNKSPLLRRRHPGRTGPGEVWQPETSHAHTTNVYQVPTICQTLSWCCSYHGEPEGFLLLESSKLKRKCRTLGEQTRVPLVLTCRALAGCSKEATCKLRSNK